MIEGGAISARPAEPARAVAGPLRLFTVFHANLDFSALPDRDLPLVIARCYWPLLALAEQYRIPLGIEMPARTLARIAREDPEWLKSFRALGERGLVEAVASGWAQVVAPLVPDDVNRANLALGREAYGELLGAVPGTWFVNEQTFAGGLAELYGEAGARALVMEWNNPASRRPELRPLRFRPARLAAAAGSLPLLWNDCIFFQKLQRAAHGACPEGEFLDAVAAARGAPGAALLCAYGGDLEIFDYRPGGPAPPGAARGAELARLGACLRALAADPAYEFRLPRDALRGLPPGPRVELPSAGDPIPCKKQPRYNPTRWAVSGRDGLGMNTRCYSLRRALRARAALDGRPLAVPERRALAELWGSDFRTRATEEKLQAFHARMGAAAAEADAALEALLPPLAPGEDVALVNPSDQPWCGDPVEVELRLPPGRLRGARVRCEPRSALREDGAQLEVSSRHRDGSVRAATLVLEPHLAPHERVALRLAAAPGPESAADLAAAATVATEQVEATFLAHRGGALAALRFPQLSTRPLLGTVPHGSFETIEYTPDFYSGHVVAVTEAAEKVTDLAPAPGARRVEAGPVRVAVEFRVHTPLGEWSKRYRLYRHHPRLDLIHTLRFQEARINSLRLGILTALPGAFERRSLAYAAVNGGARPDVFALAPGTEIAQHRPASPSVSASSCLGATEGWVSIGDAERGVAAIADRAEAAVVPLLEFADVDERPFLRVHHSAAETDETRATFLRGVTRVAFAWLGHPNDLGLVRRVAGGIERGLAVRTESGVGLARGL